MPLCLEDGCYILRVYDSWGDGMCCDYGEGSWSILGPQDEVIETGGEFGELDLEQFCTDEMSITEMPVSELLVYPNPASDLISIKGIGTGAIVRVFDVTGRSIAAEQVRSDNARISTAYWPRGWSILRVEWNDQVRLARVLLK